MACFLLIAGVHVLLLSYLENSITTAHMLRFDFAIGKQILLITFAVTMFLSTCVFASAPRERLRTR